MAGVTLALRGHAQLQHVLIAIHTDFINRESLAGRFTLEPQLLAGATVEMGQTCVLGFLQGLCVHPGKHQEFICSMIADDGRYQARSIKGQAQIQGFIQVRFAHASIGSRTALAAQLFHEAGLHHGVGLELSGELRGNGVDAGLHHATH